MTKRVYYEDTWLPTCEAVVAACRPEGEGYAVLLDRTIIFPEGGGQPSDTGRIDGVAVTDAFEEGEDIWNRVASALPAGKAVRVEVDMPRRRDHSQQHTGEHIISGLASKLYGAHNVGFHMAEEYATLDLDAPLTEEELLALERAANAVVQSNTPVTYRFIQAEALEGVTLRKQAKGLTGEVRIVYIGDTDSCTCCGTHCKSAGEVGYIHFAAWQNYKGGIRLWFLCGMRAVQAAQAQRRTVDVLAKRFSVAAEDVTQAVLRQGDELSTLKHTLRERTEKLLRYRVDELLAEAESINGVKLVLGQEAGLTMADLKSLAEKLTRTEKCVAILFAENEDALVYQLAASPGVAFSMREACSAVNAATGGKGGGKDAFAQGSAKRAGGFAETLEQLRGYLRAAMRNMGA